MKTLSNLFNWFTAKDKNGVEIKLGYVLEGNPKTLHDIEKLFKAFKIEQYFETIKSLIRPQIDLTLTPIEEDKIDTLKSKIGGRPNLAQNQEWPKNENGKSLSFIGQLNFEEISPFDNSELLPKQGIASFFYSADQNVSGYFPKDKHEFKVLYTDQTNGLIRQEFPSDLESHSIFKPNLLTFDSSLSIPTWEDDSIKGLIQQSDFENYYEASRGSDNLILGHAGTIQGPMELQCQVLSNGMSYIDMSGLPEATRKEHEHGKKDWVLLLQIGTEKEKAGMNWGGNGTLYFWIKKQDLAAKYFDNVWCVLQCT